MGDRERREGREGGSKSDRRERAVKKQGEERGRSLTSAHLSVEPVDLCGVGPDHQLISDHLVRSEEEGGGGRGGWGGGGGGGGKDGEEEEEEGEEEEGGAGGG